MHTFHRAMEIRATWGSACFTGEIANYATRNALGFQLSCSAAIAELVGFSLEHSSLFNHSTPYSDGEALIEALAEALGEREALGEVETLALAEGLTLAEGEIEADGLSDVLALGETELEGDSEALGESEADALPSTVATT